MPRRTPQHNTEALILQLRDLLDRFEERLNEAEDIRPRVLELVPLVNTAHSLGPSLFPGGEKTAARDRILLYFQHYPQQVIRFDEIMVVAGISEWARRLRELRVQSGWKIISGTTVHQMIDEGDLDQVQDGQDLARMRPDDYILLNPIQDRDAAHRWNSANEIRRKKDLSVKNRLLQYFQANIGKAISGEELIYVANGATEWARRVRELRTEEGWPIFTKKLGRPDLGVGEYVLAANQQSEVHDRQIADDVRLEVLRRDEFCCTQCGWSDKDQNSADPRFLELHHKRAHVDKGTNEANNLITLCNRCHDTVHQAMRKGSDS